MLDQTWTRTLCFDNGYQWILAELGKILEVLVLEYDFCGTRTRTRTRRFGTRTGTRTRGVGTRTRTRTRGSSTRIRTRGSVLVLVFRF
jgi:hypothetical protein